MSDESSIFRVHFEIDVCCYLDREILESYHIHSTLCTVPCNHAYVQIKSPSGSTSHLSVPKNLCQDYVQPGLVYGYRAWVQCYRTIRMWSTCWNRKRPRRSKWAPISPYKVNLFMSWQHRPYMGHVNSTNTILWHPFPIISSTHYKRTK